MIQRLFFFFSLLLFVGQTERVFAQTESNFFAEIEKSLKTGDVEAFSGWFSDNLDIEILDDAQICSKNQAKLILKKFFTKYSPKNFTFIHRSGNGSMEYGIGSLIAGGESFRLTLFVQTKDKKQTIPQIRIEKTNKK